MKSLKVGIIGGTGYVGAELIRLLSSHSKVEISAISSVSYNGKKLSSIYPNFYNISDLICEDEDTVIEKCDAIFIALPNGLSENIAEKILNKNKICIDMGADFRFKNGLTYKKWYGKDFSMADLHDKSVYGLPELNREKIKNTKIIGNPGCYATSIELALLPLISKGIIEEKGIISDSKSGVTGSGRGLSESSHFTNCNESLSAYKIAKHRHTPEIEETLNSISNSDIKLTFTPHLLPINRGILSTIYTTPKQKVDMEKIHDEYCRFYASEPFVNVLPLGEVSKINNVRLSNYCDISLHYDEENGKLILISCIDNMIKGSAGQGIQNMNIALGFDEKEGLNFVPSIF
ncbi:N-acetyl-gamma-glutamyl-phosphate reductase [Clostridium tyrobutyricum]|uniref:N-acetyl-gamma-glutamyl-phosphate reductase n=1 Tax=Clostridium tyrobutyricum TaxID=1519 RepID=UPI00047835CB|nr:N-acetyl-gamma-glutamyl-phosphate reductase [Clostridium tyrobutyricum]ANP69082.1 N-acetyl-gamma-glutamyl-phosphate reductase [Clostridium tyrobutyricum]MBR9647576.1 N-acetyl-gamma-glutamyl-phosphate reductase [Clostridium tyrobutyricum]MBV4425914.1 N-acetyl-gamma-glutamyl-phosphate reductase [Clostridium tyrobutyricum]MBV4432218.1 N-acetyl-gamma-glutamyl-phosphate reductase [Clostridium tyrobutyricum]MBV4434860.1 N-acetyl-gamma-glutamyl-phosphate reductase [Clostridium tyrobutyricum]